jgi:hypothetical protein
MSARRSKDQPPEFYLVLICVNVSALYLSGFVSARCLHWPTVDQSRSLLREGSEDSV